MLSGVGIERETRTPSQQLQGVLSSSDTSTAAGLEKTAQEVEKLGYSVEAASIRQQVKEKQKAEVSAQDKQESLIMMVRDSELTPQQKGMLMRSINADPSQDPTQLVSTIVSMGGKEPDAFRTMKATALAMGLVEGSSEWKAYFAREAIKADDTGTRERKIEDYMNSFGSTRQQAIQAIEGKTVLDPVTGDLTQFNLKSNAWEKVDVNGANDQEVSTEVPKPLPGNTVWELSELGTGPISALKAGIARTPGVSQFAEAMGLNTADAVEARAQIKNVMSEAIRGLAVNNKFPVGEIRRIQEEIDLDPKAFDSVPSYRARLKAQDTYLETRQAQANRDASDRTLPTRVRADQRANAATIANLRAYLGVPGTERGTQGEEYIMEMSQEDLENVDIGELTDEALNAYIERMQ
jgi:hypothetical protein